VIVRITSRCNMRCLHCAYSCTAKGEDMSLATFRRVVDVAVAANDDITISGGEPTLHPRLLRFLWEIEPRRRDEMCVSLLTNGTCGEALWKRLLRESHWIDIGVSTDLFHNPRRLRPWVREWLADKLCLDTSMIVQRQGRGENMRKLRAFARRHGRRLVFTPPHSLGQITVDPDGVVWSEEHGGHLAGDPLSWERFAQAYRAVEQTYHAEEIADRISQAPSLSPAP